MKKLTKVPKKGSIIKYLGGVTNENCYLIEGKEYEVLGKSSDKDGVEYSWVRMEERLDTTWYIVGGKYGNLDKFSLVEEFLDREELIELNNEKDIKIAKLESSLEKLWKENISLRQSLSKIK